MGKSSNIRKSSDRSIVLAGQRVDYRLVESKNGRKLRVRVGPQGMDVIHPRARPAEQIRAFLLTNERWILNQLKRVETFSGLRKRQIKVPSQILLRGKPTGIVVLESTNRGRGNKVVLNGRALLVLKGKASRTDPAKSLEYWLRRQAKSEINAQLRQVTPLLKRSPHKLFVMEQRTKWGNCSRLGNLSFNWRLIMAPEFVLRYIVVHEVTHLRLSDHSSAFWLTVQSLCPEAARAKQWLRLNSSILHCDLSKVCGD
jgi:predicted metal-dependent hydrolase